MYDEKSSRYRSAGLWLLSTFIVLVGVAGAGFLYYRYQKDSLREEVWKDLNAIVDLKTSQIAEWRESRHSEAQLLLDNTRLAPSNGSEPRR